MNEQEPKQEKPMADEFEKAYFKLYARDPWSKEMGPWAIARDMKRGWDLRDDEVADLRAKLEELLAPTPEGHIRSDGNVLISKYKLDEMKLRLKNSSSSAFVFGLETQIVYFKEQLAAKEEELKEANTQVEHWKKYYECAIRERNLAETTLLEKEEELKKATAQGQCAPIMPRIGGGETIHEYNERTKPTLTIMGLINRLGEAEAKLKEMIEANLHDMHVRTLNDECFTSENNKLKHQLIESQAAAVEMREFLNCCILFLDYLSSSESWKKLLNIQNTEEKSCDELEENIETIIYKCVESVKDWLTESVISKSNQSENTTLLKLKLERFLVRQSSTVKSLNQKNVKDVESSLRSNFYMDTIKTIQSLMTLFGCALRVMVSSTENHTTSTCGTQIMEKLKAGQKCYEALKDIGFVTALESIKQVSIAIDDYRATLNQATPKDAK